MKNSSSSNSYVFLYSQAQNALTNFYFLAFLSKLFIKFKFLDLYVISYSLLEHQITLLTE